MESTTKRIVPIRLKTITKKVLDFDVIDMNVNSPQTYIIHLIFEDNSIFNLYYRLNTILELFGCSISEKKQSELTKIEEKYELKNPILLKKLREAIIRGELAPMYGRIFRIVYYQPRRWKIFSKSNWRVGAIGFIDSDKFIGYLSNYKIVTESELKDLIKSQSFE